MSNTQMKLILVFSFLTGLFLTSCGKNNNDLKNQKDTAIVENPSQNNAELLLGRWVEPNPIKEQEFQGIELLQEGTAKSINMVTLLYSKWWTKDHRLFLVEKSIGNHISSIDTISYAIIKLDSDSLVLRNSDRTLQYKKQ